MDERLEANRVMWNALTGAHVKSAFYDVEGFKAGKNRLHPVELEEMGDVRGKSLLHLQCHFGLDTLSCARLGAKVTGTDISDEAIEQARDLGRETGIAAVFVCSDIYALPEALDGEFDIVFTSYGVLGWLPDLKKWAEVIMHFLRPGGFFYISEIHPVIYVFYNEDQWGDNSGLRVRDRYFSRDAEKYEGGADYASDFTHGLTSYEWQHTVGDIVTALADAGLHVDYLHEHPACCYWALPEMKQGGDGMWRLEGDPLPLTFSIRATRPVS